MTKLDKSRRGALGMLAGAAVLPLATRSSAQQAPLVRRFGGPIRPEWFEAKPDGQFDNTSALNRAVKEAAEYEQVLDLSTDYQEAVWAISETVFDKHGVTVKGGGYRSQIKALPGFPRMMEVAGPPEHDRATVAAAAVVFESPQEGPRLNESGSFRVAGEGHAPIGIMINGGANPVHGNIRIDNTTYAGIVMCGVQNALFGKFQVYRPGRFGMVLLNGCFNCIFQGTDLRQASGADLWCADDPDYPYYRYFNDISGASECLFMKGVWEDSLGGDSGPGKDHVIRMDKGSRNHFMSTQLHGKARCGIFDGPDCVGNIYAPSSLRGVGHDGKAAELRGYLPMLRDTAVTLWGRSSLENVVEVYNQAMIERIQWANLTYRNKLVANKSPSFNDARVIQYVPVIRAGSRGQRNEATRAEEIDAVTLYYETDRSALTAFDYRAGRWGDQPNTCGGLEQR